ncbi:hypothetical protein K458DRAFT_206049 [Lentithecium fluviatile CBS 122367]|uniref:Uncharacterized protein n=1 Tax=Lentithecium fluviatile CBS 122367 TaxID=1168545 RepID=A0A6G1IBZ1_9PLEO|nr:hypothetical protein K458DRAFT_206049 [Lentithecium fluviatile CBS 122367]
MYPMACIEPQHMSTYQLPPFPDCGSPSFRRARRPALIPSTSSLSLAEAEELVRSRIQQPLFPPPDPQLLQNIRPVSPVAPCASTTEGPCQISEPVLARSREASPTSDYHHAVDVLPIPRALAHDPRRIKAFLKARAQYARDKDTRRFSAGPAMSVCKEPEASPKQSLVDLGPKRKHSAFVKEEELKCLMEARVGTPHISELQADDDVSAQLKVEELSVASEVAAMGATTGPDDPDRPGRGEEAS